MQIYPRRYSSSLHSKPPRSTGWRLTTVNPRGGESIFSGFGIWFGACVIGFIPHVANAAHAIGLLAGMAWGYLSGTRSRGV